jgi:hypothetical protein
VGLDYRRPPRRTGHAARAYRTERPGRTTVAAVSIKGLQCTDYAVIRETRHRRPDDDPAPAGWDGLVPVGPPRVALGRISADDAGEFVKACTATGPNFDPAPQSPILYTFVRRNAPRGQSTWHWDVDEAIQLAVALSRRVRDNSHGIEYAVRTVEGWDSGDRQIAPLAIEARAFTYRVTTGGGITWRERNVAGLALNAACYGGSPASKVSRHGRGKPSPTVRFRPWP